MEININPDSLKGMSAADAKNYIFGFIATLKLTEKEIRSLEDEAVKWANRVELALSRGMDELRLEAEREAEKIKTRLAVLRDEERSLKDSISAMRQQLTGLAARERSIDPDLLEQELLMALGRTEEEDATEKAFEKLEKEKSADDALEALKAKLKGETT
jgi:phage shock protein A